MRTLIIIIAIILFAGTCKAQYLLNDHRQLQAEFTLGHTPFEDGKDGVMAAMTLGINEYSGTFFFGGNSGTSVGSTGMGKVGGTLNYEFSINDDRDFGVRIGAGIVANQNYSKFSYVNEGGDTLENQVLDASMNLLGQNMAQFEGATIKPVASISVNVFFLTATYMTDGTIMAGFKLTR